MIKTIPFEKLLKLELPLLTNRIIEIVEKNDPETLKIKESFDLLETLEPQLNNLEKRYGPHPITKKLNTLRESRIKHAVFIIAQVNFHVFDDLVDMRLEAEVVQPLVTRFLVNLRNYNDDIITENVDQFIRNIQESEKLTAAMTTLGMFKYIDKLQSVNIKLKELWKMRSNSISLRPNIYEPSLRKPIYGAIRNLINQINQAAFHHSELDYAPLIDELNFVLSFYRGKINSRNSYNIKRKAEAIIDNSVIDGDADDTVETTGEQDSNIKELDSTTADNTGASTEINEEKAAAMAASSMRVTNISKKA